MSFKVRKKRNRNVFRILHYLRRRRLKGIHGFDVDALCEKILQPTSDQDETSETEIEKHV